MGLFGDVMGFIDSGRAAKSVSDANIAAEHGVLGATASGQQGIQDTIGNTRQGVQGALDNANTAVNGEGANVTAAANQGNSTLQGALDKINTNLAPSIQSGAQGNKQLQDYAAGPDSKFKFNYDDYKNDPAYKFQLEQGTNAITNQASASGLSQGGSTLAALTQYGQGLAATHYNDAFNRAQGQFQTNQNATLSNLSTLINSGAQGNALSSQAGQNIAGQQSANTVNAANTNASLQEFLGNLNTNGQLSLGAQGLQGNEAAASLGLSGAKTAGDFATGAGTAHATGIINQGAALTSGVNDLGSLYAQLMGGK